MKHDPRPSLHSLALLAALCGCTSPATEDPAMEGPASPGAPSVEAAFFAEGFETAAYDASGQASASPRWRWEPRWTPAGTGMPFGPGDWYQRSMDVAHSGRWSMALDYEGRNDFGNTCIIGATPPGTTMRQQHGSASAGNIFVDDGGEDLSRVIDGAGGAVPGTHVWNRDAFFERWTVESLAHELATNDRLDFQGGVPSGAPLYGETAGVIAAGDRVRIARPCGDGERLSDIDLLENQLMGFEPDDLPPGGSVFVRFHLYVPSATALPTVGQKLVRISFKRTDAGDEGGYDAICILSVHRNSTLECSQDSGVGTRFHFLEPFALDGWSYVEMELQAATSDTASDGAFRVWFATDGNEPGEPLVEETGLPIRPGAGAGGKFVTMGGNTQSWSRREGRIYYDDIAISDHRVGPAQPN